MNTAISALLFEWVAAKQAEQEATARRRDVEERIKALADIREGTELTHAFFIPGHGTLRVVTRLDRKVDVDLLRALAFQHDLEAEAKQYFRWKAEVNLALWRTAPSEVVSAFAPAITTRPARATFTLERARAKEEAQ